MARLIPGTDAAPILAAARSWLDRCWLADQSLFRDQSVWTAAHVQELKTHFIDAPDEGDRDFYAKLNDQMAKASPSARQVMAEMLWLLLLFSTNITPAKKRESVMQVWGWSGDTLATDTPELSDAVLSGIGSTGVALNTQRWREVNYLIVASIAFKALPPANRAEILADAWAFAAWLATVPDPGKRQMTHILRYFAFPDSFERIANGHHKRDLLVAFDGLTTKQARELDDIERDRRLLAVRHRLQAEIGRQDLDFYVEPLRSRWMGKRSHWLLAWNPKHFSWEDLPALIGQVEREESPVVQWSCASSKAAIGDEAWLVRLGTGRAVIMGHGTIVKEPYPDAHWDEDKQAAGETAQYVAIELDDLRDPDGPRSIDVNAIPTKNGERQQWTPQQSGIAIKPGPAAALAALWDSEETTQHNHHQVAEPRTRWTSGRRTWVIAAGRDLEHWDRWLKEGIVSLGHEHVGDLSVYSSKQEVERVLAANSESGQRPTNHALATWEFAHVMEPGDRVFAKQGTRLIVGAGTVTGPYQYRADARPPHARSVRWEAHGQWELADDSRLGIKTLTDVTEYPEFVAKLEQLLALPNVDARHEPYTLVDLSRDTGYSPETIGSWLSRLQRKRQVVMQGPPGTGKTFLAERIAKHLVSGTNGLIEIVQFHPSYSYEDFVEGLRPVPGAEGLQFERTPGHFMKFCDEARKLGTDAPCVLIIDELNRARVSQVFGELMYGLEYRDRNVRLSSGNQFSVPGNVLVIATMNTADRSIALVDHALRRRFSFIDVPPAMDVLRRHLVSRQLPADGLINAIEQVNRTIEDPRYAVGISFFLLKHRFLASELAEIWRGEIEPYLEEFFFDQPEKSKALRWDKVHKDHLSDWPDT